MTDLLAPLQMDEVSGVDDPANGIPGWMVAKARDGGGKLSPEAQLHKNVRTLLSMTPAQIEKYRELRKEATSAPFEPEAAPPEIRTETSQQEAQRRFPLFRLHGGAPLPMMFPADES